MNYIALNRRFWSQWSRNKGPWSRPVPKSLIEKARSGAVESLYFPKDLFPENWKGLDVLGLACAGGQQMPLIAAAGACVTSFDFSKEQLQKDRETARASGLNIQTKQGEMEDLSVFQKESFDFVLNGVSVCYTKNVRKVWREVFRSLRGGGVFITGFVNPCYYSLDMALYEKKGEMRMIHKLPYSTESHWNSLSESERRAVEAGESPVEFSHSLSDLIGGQAEAGFSIIGLREMYWRDFGEKFVRPADSIIPSFIFTKAVKNKAG